MPLILTFSPFAEEANGRRNSVCSLSQRKNCEERSGNSEFHLTDLVARYYEHPLVLPQLSHLRQVPFRTMVKLPHSEQLSPS
jgi:hypothetical protein